MWYQEFSLSGSAFRPRFGAFYLDKQLRLALMLVLIISTWRATSNLTERLIFGLPYYEQAPETAVSSILLMLLCRTSRPNRQFFSFLEGRSTPLRACDMASNLARGRSDNKVGGWRGHQHERQQAK
jgi:hypothetical protein